MKVKLHQILNAVVGIQKLILFNLPVIFAFELRDLSKNIEAQRKKYEEVRLQLCNKYGKIDESKTQYIMTDENKVQFKKEIEELLNIEVDLSYKLITADKFKQVLGENKVTIDMIENLKGIIWE